jgi:hypothetical protein
MTLEPASVDARVSGKRVGGPWALPLDREAIKEIKALEPEFGRVEFKQSKEQTCSTQK